jgi:cytochrome b involved in lipid metabolism
MQHNKHLFAIGIGIVFLVGAGYIIYSGRPIMKLRASSPVPESAPSTPSASNQKPMPAPTATQTPETQPETYSMSDVQKHRSTSDCWSVVDGNVYDLTSWIDRHPGGPEAILGMCGTDGSKAYHGQHGNSRRPSSALSLLKIGTLK